MRLTVEQVKLDAAWKQAYRVLSYLARTREYEGYCAPAKILGDSIRAIRAEMESL